MWAMFDEDLSNMIELDEVAYGLSTYFQNEGLIDEARPAIIKAFDFAKDYIPAKKRRGKRRGAARGQSLFHGSGDMQASEEQQQAHGILGLCPSVLAQLQTLGHLDPVKEESTLEKKNEKDTISVNSPVTS